jgi:hypothetical protein
MARPSARANAVARGLQETLRAIGAVNLEYGMLRLQSCNGGNYWISLNGKRVHHGATLLSAARMQLGFIDGMARVGRRRN